MANILKYKGYFARIEYSAEDGVLYGKIEGIKDLVNFESDSASEIENEFHNAVDDYLELCRELGQEPDRVYSGTFNVRIDPKLHQRIAIQAMCNGETLNHTVEKALQFYMDDSARNIKELWQKTLVEGYKVDSGVASVAVWVPRTVKEGGWSYA